MKKMYLVLENGAVLEGVSIGAERESIGELVFTTGMTGYLETLTDPSYAGQIVMQTFPLIGNYGVIPEDFEGKSAVKGYVVRELCDAPSNFRSQYALDRFLKEQNIPGICGIDTRAITKLIREKGVMNAVLTPEPNADLFAVKNYSVKDVVAQVSTKEMLEFPAVGEEKYYVVLIDYGAKRNIIRSLCRRGCRVTVVPYDTKAEKILAMKPDGVMLSNGPGDPAENTGPITELKKLIGKVPIFGICLGHQLLALAMGGKTEKLKFGHRGVNQPALEKKTGKAYITSQNHGYAVIADSLPAGAEETFINANDGSCEGISYPGKRAFSVQFHPEGCGGPQDTAFLFDRFLSLMKGENHA